MSPLLPDPTPEPPQRDHDSRERLLAAGTELFGKKGFHGCGLTEILQHAGVPKGSFYHHFHSKEEFGVVLIERARDEFLAELRPILGDLQRSPLQRLRTMFEHIRGECAAHGPTVECLIPKLALETANLSAPVLAAVRDAYAQANALVADVLRQAQRGGEIDAKADAEHLAKVLLMLWEGATLRMQIERSTAPLDDFLAYVLDSILHQPPSPGAG
ncbi:MAG: TetR/AcrR family transcriptional regulator, transcriptional repressor for nem operon [Planctomycetota bacterium]|jgi:TetR/AcrR family transcriptional repressor of nem operon